MTDRTPARAPGIRAHRQRYVLAVTLPSALAEALADEWERTGESPAKQTERALMARLENDDG